MTEVEREQTIGEAFLQKIRKKGRPSWSRTNQLDVRPDWKHPELHYRWAENQPDRIWNLEQRGYVMANAESGGALKNTEFRSDQPGGAPVRGQNVLMVNSRENIAAYENEVAKRTDHTVMGMKDDREGEFAKLGREHGISAQLRTRMVIE